MRSPIGSGAELGGGGSAAAARARSRAKEARCGTGRRSSKKIRMGREWMTGGPFITVADGGKKTVVVCRGKYGSPAAPRRLWVRSLVGMNFRLRVKKLSHLPHVQNTVEPGLTHKATGPVYGWGRGSGVFLACCEKVILPLK